MTVMAFKKKSIILAIIFILVSCFLITSIQKTDAYLVYYNKTVRKLPIYSVQTEEKILSISFDCAWGVEKTDEILEVLKRNDIKATFFMVEFWAEKYPEYVEKISSQGHEIGTHSATHSHMSRQSAKIIEDELLSSSKVISDITGKGVDLFRAPFGDYNDTLINTAAKLGFFTIQWDVDSLDWKDISSDEIAMRVINKAKCGSIVLFHNNALHTVGALPVIIQTLKNKGYEFVPIGELIYRENFTIDSQGRQQKVNDS